MIISKIYKMFFIVLLGLILLPSSEAFSQKKSRRQLENEKKRTMAKIEEAKRILAETKAQKQTTIGQVKAIKEQIQNQEEQISLMEEDLGLIDMEMQEIVATTADLQKKLAGLQKEYGAMLYAASKSSGKLTKLNFLFSSSSFNELAMRYKYLQQYTENRKAQVNQINKVAALLKERQESLSNKKLSKKQTIQNKLVQTKNLENLKVEQTQMIGELSKKEQDLRSQIEKTNQSVKRLDNLIASVVAREIARKNRERELRKDREAKRLAAKRNNSTKSSKSGTKEPKEKEEIVTNYDDEDIKLGESFASSKARLPWPVQRGFISERFGVKEHAVLKGVLVNNNGVDIQTSQGSAVRSVYSGEVMDISEIPGLNKVVAIQHGNYFTVYANLSQVFVSSGQKVSSKENIGTAAQNNGVTEINFQIWHNTSRLNPEGWLIAR